MSLHVKIRKLDNVSFSDQGRVLRSYFKLQRHLRRESCRCMGPSGSCTWKYCVKSIDDFSKIASDLYSKYRERGSLREITYDMHGQSRPDIKRITDLTLVYNSQLDIWFDTRQVKYCYWHFIARKQKNEKRFQ